MQDRLWIAFAVVAGMSFAIQVLQPVDLSDRPETTFDTAPRGHAGLFVLLERFDATRGRWLSGVTLPPTNEPIWWIAPADACVVESGTRDADAMSASGMGELARFEVTIRPWIEAGGTAIVWLSQPPLEMPEPASAEAASEDEAADDRGEADEPGPRDRWESELADLRAAFREGAPRECESILGIGLPTRTLAGLEGGALPEEGQYAPIVFSVGRAPTEARAFDYEGARTLPGQTLALFRPTEPGAAGDAPGETGQGAWRAVWVEANGGDPLALERSVGDGRLVVIADARILSNDRLGHVDSAPFVFDWIRDYGPPWIDEHAHGVVPETGTVRYLAASPAQPAAIGLLLLGVLVAWRGHAWPTRHVSEFDPDAPTLSAFVDSVARLYSGSEDHRQVFEQYRRVCLDQIRRTLGLAPGVPVETVLERLRNLRDLRTRAIRAADSAALHETGLRQLLATEIQISSASDLARQVARLDDLVRVLRGSGSTPSPRDRKGNRE